MNSGGDRHDRDSLTGTLEVLAAAGLWGTSGVFSVVLFRRGVEPVDVALLRPLAATLFLVAWSFVREPSALRPGLRDGAVLWCVGGTVTAVFQIGYQMATDAVGVPATVGMLYLAPLIVLAASRPLLGETPSRAQVGWGLLAVFGVWAVVSGARGVDVDLTAAGVGWGLATAAGYAGYTLFGRWGGRLWSPLTTVLHSHLGASAILLLALPWIAGPVSLPEKGGDWLLLLAYGFFTVALAVVLFYDALRRIPASRASITATVEPVVAAILATLVLGQQLTPGGWAGLALVVAGVVGAARLSPREGPS